MEDSRERRLIMKKIKKRFLAMGVCLAVLFCFLAPVQPANAAAKTVHLTVRYKGKNVTFLKFRNVGASPSKVKGMMGAKTYAAVKKAWGKANKVEKDDFMGEGNSYTWKNGKTRIAFGAYKNGKRKGDVVIDIQNKKASLCGIKVGMSKRQATQKLIKQFGKKNVSVTMNQILVQIGYYHPIEFNLKSEKVSGIYFMSS